MEIMHYIGLDIHKKVIAFCIKTWRGEMVNQGKIQATRKALGTWVENLPKPWTAAMEATLFTGWIYDHGHKWGRAALTYCNKNKWPKNMAYYQI